MSSQQPQQPFAGFSNALNFNTSQFDQFNNKSAGNQFQLNSNGSLHQATGQFNFDSSQIPSQFSFSAQPAAQAAPQWSAAQFSSAPAAPQWSAAQFSAPQLPAASYSYAAPQAAPAAAPQWSAQSFQSPDLASKWSAITQSSTSAAAAFQQPHAAYSQFPQLSAAQIQSVQSQAQPAAQAAPQWSSAQAAPQWSAPQAAQQWSAPQYGSY